MAIVTDERKAELILMFGEQGCITPASVITAMFSELNGTVTFNADEFDWLYKISSTACTPLNEPEVVLPTSRIAAIVSEVIDGDTIKILPCQDLECQLTPLGGIRVRLWHISAPDLTYQAGIAAKSWLESKLPSGTQISLDVRGMDPYDRYVAVVYKGAENINNAIVAAGHARAWSVDDHTIADVPLPAVPEHLPASTGIQLISASIPETIGANGNSWWSAEIKNIGTEARRFYLGVVLVNTKGEIFEYSGNQQYAVLLSPTKTGTLRANFDIPQAYWNDVEVVFKIKAVKDGVEE